MNNTIQKLWDNYIEVAPSIEKVKSSLNLQDYQVFNDHIAFRSISFEPRGNKKLTYNNYGIETIIEVFQEMGYQIKGFYHFKEKKLRAVHLECDLHENLPKIFISGLLLDECSFFLKRVLLNSFSSIDVRGEELLTVGRTWNVSYKIYKMLERESEYAAWLYIHGYRVNHFTLNVNQLKGYSLENVCAQLRTSGIRLNNSGGVIKGSDHKGLKQASTMADQILVKFVDLEQPVKIPSCYVEFSERFTINDKYFKGFLTKSADKIFESTDRIA